MALYCKIPNRETHLREEEIRRTLKLADGGCCVVSRRLPGAYFAVPEKEKKASRCREQEKRVGGRGESRKRGAQGTRSRETGHGERERLCRQNGRVA